MVLSWKNRWLTPKYLGKWTKRKWTKPTPHFLKKVVVLVWCGCGVGMVSVWFGRRCQLCATVRTISILCCNSFRISRTVCWLDHWKRPLGRSRQTRTLTQLNSTQLATWPWWQNVTKKGEKSNSLSISLISNCWKRSETCQHGSAQAASTRSSWLGPIVVKKN